MKIDAETIARFAERYAVNLCSEGVAWPYTHLFFAAHIPDEPRLMAPYAGFGQTETALVLIDNSILGLAKSGLLVSDTHIHYSLPFSATQDRRVKGAFPLADLDTLDFIHSDTGIDVHLNGKHVGWIAGMDEGELQAINTFFRKIFRKELGSLRAEAPPVGTDADAKIPHQDDPEVIDKLRAYERHQQVFCLQCGYDGLMGVEKRWLPWYLTWWVIFPMLISSVGLVPGIVLWLNRSSSLKFNVKCPNCEAELQTL